MWCLTWDSHETDTIFHHETAFAFISLRVLILYWFPWFLTRNFKKSSDKNKFDKKVDKNCSKTARVFVTFSVVTSAWLSAWFKRWIHLKRVTLARNSDHSFPGLKRKNNFIRIILFFTLKVFLMLTEWHSKELRAISPLISVSFRFFFFGHYIVLIFRNSKYLWFFERHFYSYKSFNAIISRYPLKSDTLPRNKWSCQLHGSV